MTPEGRILNAILQYLAARHILAFRNNVLAMPTADGKRFIKAGTPGMADIVAFTQCGYHRSRDISQWVWWLEVKTATGKQSELQKSFQQQVESHGHRYAVVRSVEDVEELLR